MYRPTLKERIDVGKSDQNGYDYTDFVRLAKLKKRPSYTSVALMFNRNWRTIKSCKV
jgi:hypothetical protein